MPDQLVTPARRLSGALRPPGDKSISHRCALLAALADGDSILENYSTGADCQSSLDCVAALGIAVGRADGAITIPGRGMQGLRAPAAALDAGNSGSTMRMFSGVLAAQPFASEIAGDASLSRRPMHRIIEPLGRMGARIAAAPGDRPPLRFEPPGMPLHAIEYVLPVASAQVKSAILFAALFAEGTTVVAEPLATRDHSELLLRAMGGPLERRVHPRVQVELTGPVERLAPFERFRIPGDPSSAAFFLCAAACLPGSDLLVDDVSLNPTRSALLDLLARLGAKPQVVSVEERVGELVGSLHLDAPAALGASTVEVVAGAEAVALVDEIPILAVLATRTRAGMEFRDLAELRVKESDRIAAIAHNLRAMGARCEERPEGLAVPGGQKLRGARLDSFGDHRIAMAFAIAALLADGESAITGAECVAISYPEFFTELVRLTER